MADPNNKNGAQYVVANALYTCQYGVTPAQLQVTQNQKLLAQNKLVATDKEIQFNPPAQTFGVCSMNPNKQAGQPCLYAQGKWNPTTLYQSNNTKIVTEDSEMLCTMFSGKIKTIFPGQVASVSVPQLEGIEMEFAPFLIWEVNSEQNAKDLKKKMSSFKVSKIKMGNFLSGNGTEIKCRKGEKYLFEVTDKLDNKQAKYVSWIVGRKTDRMQTVEVEKKVNGKTKKTQQDLPVYEWVPYELIGTQFQIAFHHLDDYFVGAVGYGTDFYNRQVKDRKDIYEQVEPSSWNAMFFVHVQDNRIESVSVKECTRVVGDTYYVKKSKSAITVTAKTELPYDTNFEMVGCLALQKDYGKMPEGMCHYKYGELEMKMEPGNVGQEYLVHFIMTKKGIPVGFPSVWSSKDIVICFYDIATIKCTSKEWFKKDCSGKFPKARPGNDFVFEVVKSDGTSGEKFDLIDWKILFNGKEIKEIKDQKSIAYNLYEIGKYEIKAFLNDTAYYSDAFQQKKQPHDSSLVKEISHTIEVKNNTVESVSLLPNYGVKYVGVEYPIEIMYDYGANTTPEEIAAVTLNAPGAIVDKKRLVFKANKPSNGYVINATLNGETTSSRKISIVECEYSIWTFCDTNGNHIDKIGWIRNDGKEYEFGIIGCVPSWCYVNGTPKDNRKITVVLKETTTKQVVATFPNIELSDEGEFRVNNIKSGEIVKFLLEKCGFAKGKDIRLMFCVYNAPSSIVKNLSQSLDYGLFAQSNTLTITNGFFVEGSSFIDSDNGKKLIAIKKYGDKVKIRMQIINPGKKKLCLRIYENCSGLDELRKEYEESDFGMDENGVVEIDVPTDEDGCISHKDHNKYFFTSHPRLFYYILVDKNEDAVSNSIKQTLGGNNVITSYKIVHSYPQTPGDAYRENYTLGKDTSMNYFEQMKLVPETEENEFCKTYATLAPVVVGDDDKKTEEEQNDKCACPNCHEEAEDLEKRLRKAFPKAPAGNAKIVAETYTKYMRRLHMDTCWVKAYFFANISIESGMKLTPRSESGIYSRETLEETKPSKIFEGNWVGGKYESKKDTSGKKETSSDGRVYQPGLKKKLDDMYDKKGDEKEKAIYNFMYDGENGNDQDGDGYKYRGGAFVQITGRTNYQMVQRMLNVFYDKDVDIMANGCDSFPDNIELATVASMCYLFMKYGDHYRLCNGQKDGMSQYCEKVMGHNLSGLLLCNTCMNSANDLCDMKKNNNIQCKKIKVKGDGCKTTNYGAKQTMLNEFSTIFELDDCKWESRGLSGIWVDPLKNLMACYYSQNGHPNPQNSIFTKKRNNNGHTPHQGVDLFAEECTMTYACMDGKVKVKNRKWGADHGDDLQYIVLEVAKESLPVFQGRRRDYTPIHTDPVAYSEVDDDPTFKPDSESIYIIYMHLYGAFVSNEQTVHAGQPIGLTGRSGVDGGTCDPHLHFEIKSKDTYRDGLKNRCNPAHYVYYKQFRNGKGENEGKIELFDSNMQMTTIEATNLDSNEDLKIQKERMEKGKTPAMKNL